MPNSIVQSTSLEISNINDALVVDSRLIAMRLGIQHETLLRTIRKYESKIEQRFGCIRFEIGVPESATGAGAKQIGTSRSSRYGTSQDATTIYQ
jgi:phage regulator Rha-like protein